MLRRNRHGRPKIHRLRRFFQLRAVRGVGVLILVFFVWIAFSVRLVALSAPERRQYGLLLAEWARDHYLGPVVTFGEWLTYNPPKAGGKPSFSLAVPSGQAISSSAAAAGRRLRVGQSRRQALSGRTFRRGWHRWQARR